MLFNDKSIKQDVENKLEFEPAINSKNIMVTVDEGIVTLSGTVKNYYEKLLAENAAKNVRGVKGVAEELRIDTGASKIRSDTEIVNSVNNSLSWHAMLPTEDIKVVVENGIVKLSGEVEHLYQRNAAESAVRFLYGVKGVINNITVKPPIKAQDIKSKITSEFQRNAVLDAKKIDVEVTGGTVVLKGFVRSWLEIKEATDAAWKIPGVTHVDNQLSVSYS